MQNILSNRPQAAQSLFEDPTVLALAVIGERARRLSVEDRRDLFELTKEWLDPETDEEGVESAWRAILEILAHEPIRVSRMELIDENAPFSPGLKKWIDFVAAKIRELRLQAGLTQTQLAERSGLPQSHVSRLEGRKHSPTRVTLEKIAAALGRPLSDLDPSTDDRAES